MRRKASSEASTARRSTWQLDKDQGNPLLPPKQAGISATYDARMNDLTLLIIAQFS